MTKRIPTPMLDKQAEVRKDAQPLGEFLEWLRHTGYQVLGDGDLRTDTESILANYFDIDMDRIEAERQLLLADLQERRVISELKEIAE